MADPPAEKKKGFGEKLKGVGKAIGRGLKKVPGIAYRDVVKPYGAHMRDKFTEPTVRKVDLKRTVTPGLEPWQTTVSRKEAPTVSRKGQGISHLAGPIEKLPIARRVAKPKRKRTVGRGKTTAYDMPGKSAVERLNETAPKAAPKEKPTQKKPTPKKEPTTASEGRKTKSTDLTAKARIGEVVTVIGEMPKEKKATPRTTMIRPPRRKFSPKRTAATLTKAGKARREQMAAVPQPDTTAQEMARLMTEQDIAREAQRTESALKEDRKPRREKARYRYRTRGLKRSEGRGR